MAKIDKFKCVFKLILFKIGGDFSINCEMGICCFFFNCSFKWFKKKILYEF